MYMLGGMKTALYDIVVLGTVMRASNGDGCLGYVFKTVYEEESGSVEYRIETTLLTVFDGLATQNDTSIVK